MLNYIKWLSGLALVGLCTVGDLPGVFPKSVARAQTSATSPANQKAPSTRLSARNRGSGEINVVYGETNDPLSASLIEAYQRYGYFDKIGALITSEIALPHDITVVLADCEQANAFYNSEHHAIVICNQLTKENYRLLRADGYSEKAALKTAILSAVFTFYHEAGHMLIHELDLPAVGREEDNVDQFSAFFLIVNDSSVDKSNSGEILLAAAKMFSLQPNSLTSAIIQDEHSLSQQRLANLVCMLYGAAPSGYQDLVKELDYSESRLAGCQSESTKIFAAWKRLLEPYLKT
jgi:Putative metallopeptidase